MIHLTEAFGGHRGGFDPVSPFEAKLNDHIAAGNVSVRYHPDLPLSIYNYTPQCAYNRTWDEVTLNCRGLILDQHGFIVARPFPKFFNLGEHEAFGNVPNTPPTYVYDKMDGSLGIAYQYDGHIGVATRGSFMSEQALWATEWLLQNHWDWVPDEDVTSLFEIIYPENRIVVNYGDRAEMVLLARIRNEDGFDFPVSRFSGGWPGAIVDSIATRAGSDDLVMLANARENSEGFVCVWPQKDGPSLRIKIKSDDYIAMHRVVTGLSNRIVWEHMAAGTVEELRDQVPDEMYDWFDEQVSLLYAEFDRIYSTVHAQLSTAKFKAGPHAERSTLAHYIKMTTYPGLCFAMLDGKPVSSMIWKMIRPERETPILTVQEDA